MITCICGSRSITTYSIIEQGISIVEQSGFKITEVVSGCAIGPDKLGETWAVKIGIPITRMPALWSKYGISAGFIRNKEMAEYSDLIISFYDGKSKGSKHMIEYCKEIGKKNLIFLPPYDKFISGEEYVDARN